MRRNLILFILTLVCSSGAWAQMNFISEVKISAEAGGTENKQRLINDGFTVIDQDLNAHEGGRDIYIGYKTTPHAEEAITGLLIMESGSGVDVRLTQYKTTPITYLGKNYYRCDSYGSDYVDCDLNRKSGGADITLYYTKDGNTNDGGTPFIALTAVGENKSMSGYLYTRHWIYGTSMISTAENDVYGNTNEDNGSYKIYLPYKVHTHAYTATFNWADDGHSCSVTTQCACGDGSTVDATITSRVKTSAIFRVDGVSTYTAKITLHNKEFTDTKDVQDIVMPLDEVKTVVKGRMDYLVAQETRADMSSFGTEKKALVDAATTHEVVLAILDAFPADLDAALALVLAQAKSDAQAVIQAVLQGETDVDLLRYENIVISNIENATSIAQINKYKADALAEIPRLKEFLLAKNDAKAAIQEALEGVTDEAILAVANTADTDIDYASSVDMVNSIKSNALAEIQRLKELGIVKADAIAAIEALIRDTEDALAISEADKYIALIRAAQTAAEVNSLLNKATEIINNLLDDRTAAIAFTFSGTGMPTETQHALEGVKMTYSADGEQMIVTINGKAVTYPLSQVSELTYFRGTPSVELTTHENPADPGFFYTTFYSGLEAYAIPDGVKAYTASLATYGTETWLNLSEVTGGLLPQGEAVLLKSTAAAISMETTTPVSASGANMLSGVDVATATTAIPGTVYTLSGEDGLMAFYRYVGATMPANKAYLGLPAGAPAPRRIAFGSHTTTGVENTEVVSVEKILHNGQLLIRKNGHLYNAQGLMVK